MDVVAMAKYRCKLFTPFIKVTHGSISNSVEGYADKKFKIKIWTTEMTKAHTKRHLKEHICKVVK